MEDSLEPNLMVVVPSSVDSSEPSSHTNTQDNPLGLTPNLFSHSTPSPAPGNESPSFTCLQLSARESQYHSDTSTSFDYSQCGNVDVIPASPDDLHIDLCLSPKSSDLSRMSDSDSPCKRHSDDVVNSPEIIPCTNSQENELTDVNSNYVEKSNTNEFSLQEQNSDFGNEKTVSKTVYEEDTQIYSECELKSRSEPESEARESMADFVAKCIENKVASSQCILTGSTQQDSEVVNVPPPNKMSSKPAAEPHTAISEYAKVDCSPEDVSQRTQSIHLNFTFSQSQSQLDDAVSQTPTSQVAEAELVTSKCDEKTESNSQTIEYTQDSEVICASENERTNINNSNSVSQSGDCHDLKHDGKLTDENLATLPFSNYGDSQSQVQDDDSMQSSIDIMAMTRHSKDSQLPTASEVPSAEGYRTTPDLDELVQDAVKQVIETVINQVETNVSNDISSLSGLHSGEKSPESSTAAENTSQESNIGLFLVPDRSVRSNKLLPASQTSSSMESEVSASGPGYEEEDMDKSTDTIPVENNSDRSTSLETGGQVSPSRVKDQVVYRITKYVVKEKLLNDRVIDCITYHHKPLYYCSDPSSSHSSSGSGGYLADTSSLSRSSSNSSTQTHLSQSPGQKTQSTESTLRRNSSGTSGSSVEGFLRPATSLSAKFSKLTKGNLEESNLSPRTAAPLETAESPKNVETATMMMGSESVRTPIPKIRRGRVVLTPIDYVNLPGDYTRIPATAFGNVTDSPIASGTSAKVSGSVATPPGGAKINPISVSTPVPGSSAHGKNEDSFSDGTTSDSPEIPYPDSFPQISQHSSQGSSENLLPPRKEDDLPVKLNIKDGIPILAKAGGENFYYPGVIRGQDPNTGKYTIWFEDDGKERVIRENDILLIDKLPVGQEVFAQSDSDDPKDWYSAGTILCYWRENDQRGYVVQKAATDSRNIVVRRYSRKQVIVRQNDLGDDLKKLRVQPVSSPTSANVSLDNIVDGKRKRRSALALSSASSSSKSSGSTPKILRSTRKRSAAADSQSSESSASVPFPSTHKSKRARLSFDTDKPAGTKQKAVEKNKQSEIFKNCGFLMTSTTGSDQPSSEFDSPPYSSNTIIYDRDAVKKMIFAGQGFVAKTFPQLMSCDRSQLYVISDGFCRTMSYFSALATGIACLSYLWITDCTSTGRLKPTESYLLQAGYSSYHQRVVERSTCHSQPLSGMHICLQINNAMTTKWNALLSVAGCHSVSNLQKDAALSCDVLVADPSCPDEVVQRAKNLKIPVVSLEWVIQCLISSEMLPFDGHCHFKHTSN